MCSCLDLCSPLASRLDSSLGPFTPWKSPPWDPAEASIPQPQGLPYWPTHCTPWCAPAILTFFHFFRYLFFLWKVNYYAFLRAREWSSPLCSLFWPRSDYIPCLYKLVAPCAFPLVAINTICNYISICGIVPLTFLSLPVIGLHMGRDHVRFTHHSFTRA